MAKNHANGTKAVRGYKAFNSNWTCKGFQYEVGETYKIEGEIKICERGFHFCTELIDCFTYYPFGDETKVAEVEATGLIIGKDDDNDDTSDSKKCTNEITIVREIPWYEIIRLCNIGKRNTGYGNTGHHNTGNHNTGVYNTGNWNTGYYNTGGCNTGNRNTGDANTGNGNTGCYNTGGCNTGNRNTGDHNTGNRNTGDHNTGNYNTSSNNAGDRNTGRCNIGNWNTGRCNIGDRNTGDWNIASNSSGCFCTETKKIDFFDKPSDMTLYEWKKSYAYEILMNMPDLRTTVWVRRDDMTKEEKKEHPEFETIEGYLRVIVDESALQKWFDSLSSNDKRAIMSIPNFDAEKFLLCTGIDVRK